MGRIKKDYHELDELIARWNLSEADLRYAVENGKLPLSVRIYAQPMELGAYEQEEWGQMPVPYHQGVFDGVVDLRRYDIYRLFLEGEVRPCDFSLPDGDYASLMHDSDARAIRRANLVVREDARIEFEREVLGTLGQAETGKPDFRRFAYAGRVWNFTEMQARGMLFLFESARSGDPEQHFRKILDAAHSGSDKIAHLYSSRRDWNKVILKATGRLGWYFLEPGLVVAMSR
ncbi:hypothetical protein [Novosphingobium sp.]|uniref:hypothetical protein n=1 Tax=Novosphingobium sp. TaxID=1874826 RepID=UPI0035B00722